MAGARGVKLRSDGEGDLFHKRPGTGFATAAQQYVYECEQHLACAERVGEEAICVTGEVSHEDREKYMSEIRSGKKKILFGTQAIFSEGISLNNLSCLILGTPINNEPLLTQLIGRVIRKEENKRDPVIVDIHLKGNTAKRQASTRMGHYMKQGYQIKQL